MGETWPPFAFLRESDWGQCILSFIQAAYERSGSKSTLHHYTHALTLFFSTPPARLPDAYTRADVLAFMHSPGLAPGRVGKPVSAGTINNRLSILTSFYAYASAYGTIDDATGLLTPLMTRIAPTAGIKQLQRPQPPYRALNAQELHQFFAAIDTSTVVGARDYAVFLAYFILARRRAEVLRLRWGDIRQEVIVEAGECRSGYVYRFTSKGHSRQSDSAEMPLVCYTAILAYLEKSGKLESIQDSDPIFTGVPHQGRHSYDPRRPLAAGTVYAACKRIARRAGLDPKRVTIHSFRHSSARERYASGSDIRTIQQLLRHRSLSTTDTYLAQLTSTGDSGYRLIQAKFDDL